MQPKRPKIDVLIDAVSQLVGLLAVRHSHSLPMAAEDMETVCTEVALQLSFNQVVGNAPDRHILVFGIMVPFAGAFVYLTPDPDLPNIYPIILGPEERFIILTSTIHLGMTQQVWYAKTELGVINMAIMEVFYRPKR